MQNQQFKGAVNRVAIALGCPAKAFLGRGRSGLKPLGRQLVMARLHWGLKMSHSKAAKALGCCRTNVLYGLKALQDRMDTEPGIHLLVQEILEDFPS